MIGRLLVALDGSARAPGVLAAALEIGTRFGAKMIPFRALTIPPDFPPSAHVEHGDPLPTYMLHEAERALAALLAALPAGSAVAAPVVVVRSGQPWRAILEAAEELDVDLIVVGSHGYHGLDRILGTTAGKVANLARRNVLVVHNRIEPPPSSATTSS